MTDDCATASVSSRKFPGIRVLVAEDDPVCRMITSGMLRKLGCHSDLATHGQQALAALSSSSYDLVVMDVQMPELDGLKTTAAIRLQEQSTGQHIPIIGVTANVFYASRERCLAAGMDDWLAKPFAMSDLADRIAHLAGVPAHQQASPNSPAAPPLIFDRAELLRRVGEDEAQLEMVLDLFLTDTAARLQAVKDDLNNDNIESLARHAHSIKGASGMVAAHAMRTAAEQLEQVGKQQDRVAIPCRLLALCTEFSRFEAAVRNRAVAPVRNQARDEVPIGATM